MGRARSFFFENKNTTQYVGGPLKKRRRKDYLQVTGKRKEPLGENPNFLSDRDFLIFYDDR